MRRNCSVDGQNGAACTSAYFSGLRFCTLASLRFSVSLTKRPGWHIVCEVSDGEETITKAAEFRPDVILLDIGLPKLNAINAAQISRFVPGSKTLFLSAFDSEEVVEEALHTGASGYLVKLDAVSELVAAAEAVPEGKHFVSNRLKGHF